MTINNSTHTSQETVGHFLKERRHMAGIEIVDVAQHLRIKPEIIKAIEDNDDDQLPEEVYVIGFIKSYARFLGLDVTKTVLDYRREEHHKLKTPELVFPETQKDHRLMPPIAVICGFLILFGGYFLWYIFGDSQKIHLSTPTIDPASLPVNQAVKNVPPALPTSIDNKNIVSSDSKTDSAVNTTQKNNNSQFGALYTPKETKNASAVNTVQNNIDSASKNSAQMSQNNIPVSQDILALRAADWCKVEVKDKSGNKVFSSYMQPGDEWIVPKGNGPYHLSTDNMGSLRLRYDQEMSNPIGVKNVPGEDIAITLETFKSHTSKKSVTTPKTTPFVKKENNNSQPQTAIQTPQSQHHNEVDQKVDHPSFHNLVPSSHDVTVEKLRNDNDNEDENEDGE